jgi:heme o synthase
VTRPDGTADSTADGITDAAAPTSRPATGPGDAADGVGPMHTDGRYEASGRAGAWARLRPWVLATKPRIIELLLVTTVPAMVVAQGGWPSTWLVVATLIGGTLSAASANAINNELDRDIDRIMARTSARPTASGELGPGKAMRLGVVLGIAGFTWLTIFVNIVAASLATLAILIYVFVYTLGLKRRSPQAVTIGGIAGCMPVLTGWAAVDPTGFGDPRPWLLFAIMLWWQPPHFWALAFKYREDYLRAGLPMLPVTHGHAEAARQILLHSYLLLAVVLLYIAGAQASLVFVIPALGLTFGWLWVAHRLHRDQTVQAAMRLFHYSTSYLALVFIAAAADALV